MAFDRNRGFDPAAHLVKQGWKGKGTAFKPGHATRHLATVKKRDLGGLGKNRDEAQPFWDHIFASTAASLSLPSSGLPGSPGPSAARPSMGGPSRPSGSAWQTQTTPTISTSVRVGREVARRGLYSRFFRGSKASEPEPEPEEDGEQRPASDEAVVARIRGEVADAGRTDLRLSLLGSVGAGPGTEEKAKRVRGEKARRKSKKDADGGEGVGSAQDERGETKEERRARRAEKKRRKEEKRTGDAAAVAGAAEQAGQTPVLTAVGETIKEKKRKRAEAETAAEETTVGLSDLPESSVDAEGKSRKKKRKDGRPMGEKQQKEKQKKLP